MDKDKKRRSMGLPTLTMGDGCNGFPDALNTLFDTIEEARKVMEAEAKFFADANEIPHAEIVHKGKNNIRIDGKCSWAIVTFEVWYPMYAD